MVSSITTVDVSPRVAGRGRVLEPHRGDDPVAMLIEPLRTPQKEPGVIVSRDPVASFVEGCAAGHLRVPGDRRRQRNTRQHNRPARRN